MDPTGQQILRATRGPMARVAISSVVRGRAIGRTARKQTKGQPAAEPATAVQRRGGGDNENSHVNGNYENYVADGVISKEEAAMYTPDQLEFLVRKRSPSPTPRQAQLPKRPPTAVNRSAASDSMDPIAQFVADGTITSQEAAMYTPDQLDFLIRKRKSEGTGPASSQTRLSAAPRAASPVRRATSPAPPRAASPAPRRAASPAPRAVSPAPRAASSAPRPTARRTEDVRSSDASISNRVTPNGQAAPTAPPASAPPSPAPSTVAEYLAAGIITQEEADMYTPDQLEFLIRIRRRSASPAPLKSPASAAARGKSVTQRRSQTTSAPALKSEQSTTSAALKDSGVTASSTAADTSSVEPDGSAVLVGATLATVVGIGVGLYFAPDDLSQLGKMFPALTQQAEQVAPKPVADSQKKEPPVASAVKEAPAPAAQEATKPAPAATTAPPPPIVQEAKKQPAPSTPATIAAEAKVKDVQEQQEKLREQQDQMKALLADLQEQEKNEKVMAQQAKLRAQQEQMKVMLGKLEVQEEKLEAKEEKLMEDLKAAEDAAAKKAETSAAKKAPEAKAPPPAAAPAPEPKVASKPEPKVEAKPAAPAPKADEAPQAAAVKAPEPKPAEGKQGETKPAVPAPKVPEAKPEAKAPAVQGDVKADAGGAKSAGGDAPKTREADNKPNQGADSKKQEASEESSDNKLIFVGAGIAALGLGGLLFSPIGTFRRQDAEPEPVPEPVNKNLPIWARPQAQTVKRQVGGAAPPAPEPVNLLVPILAATVVGLTAGVAGGVLAALYLLPK